MITKIVEQLKKINLLNDRERKLVFLLTFIVILLFFYFPFIKPTIETYKEYSSIIKNNDIVNLKQEKEKYEQIISNNPKDVLKKQVIEKKNELNNLNKQSQTNNLSKIDLLDILKKSLVSFPGLKIQNIEFKNYSAIEQDDIFFKHVVEITLSGNYQGFKNYLTHIKKESNLNIEEIKIKSNEDDNKYVFSLTKIDEFKEWK